MNQQAATETISDNLEAARQLIETALNLGKEHNVPVDLGQIGISEDMWYVDPVEYRLDYIHYNYGIYNHETGDYTVPELTAEELAEVDAHMEEIVSSGGYNDNYKVTGWMSSSTNC